MVLSTGSILIHCIVATIPLQHTTSSQQYSLSRFTFALWLLALILDGFLGISIHHHQQAYTL